jgi:hypothetical protein
VRRNPTLLLPEVVTQFVFVSLADRGLRIILAISKPPCVDNGPAELLRISSREMALVGCRCPGVVKDVHAVVLAHPTADFGTDDPVAVSIQEDLQ